MYNKNIREVNREVNMEIDEKDVFLEERICMYMMLLKITPNLKGYKYLKECIKQIYADSTKKFKIKEKLYFSVAQKFQEKVCNIDRALRHAVMVSFNKNGIEDFEKFLHFHFYNDKPSPRELLCVLVERVIVDTKRMIANKSKVLKRWKASMIV